MQGFTLPQIANFCGPASNCILDGTTMATQDNRFFPTSNDPIFFVFSASVLEQAC